MSNGLGVRGTPKASVGTFKFPLRNHHQQWPSSCPFIPPPPMSQGYTKEGTIPFHVPGLEKPCQTWYKIVGDIHAHKPLVILHGGPGVPHYIFNSLTVLSTVHSIPIVLYDQLGCGGSTRLPDKKGDWSFWTVQLFIDELHNLLSHLSIQKYDLLGGSWGGMLGANFAIGRPKGLERLILMSAPASMQLWMDAQATWRSQLPEHIRKALDKHEADGTTDDKEYTDAVEFFYHIHFCRLETWPDDLLQCQEATRLDNTVYSTMIGPNEFFITGSLKTWSVVDSVHKINAPTLVLNGEFDEAADIAVKPFVDSIPDVRWIQFKDCSHTSHFEEPAKFIKAVVDFLKS